MNAGTSPATTVAFRRATADDAPVLGEHRARLWREATDVANDALRAQVAAWSAWFARTIADGTFVAWIAEDGGAVVGSGGLLLVPAIPRPGSSSDREGRVHSVWIEPAMRRRGIAWALMETILAHARAERLTRLKLHPSEIARSLYTKMGFVPLDEMGLSLVEGDTH